MLSGKFLVLENSIERLLIIFCVLKIYVNKWNSNKQSLKTEKHKEVKGRKKINVHWKLVVQSAPI